ncbi:unnamed protein product [Trichobilharzia regenti]|nr:unnamed protein product [Trichobilharzia regenti]
MELKKQMDPYDKLWRTALAFDTCHKEWLQAPYHTLDPYDIEQQVTDMYKTIHKLTKVVAELPGPSKVAQKVKVSCFFCRIMSEKFDRLDFYSSRRSRYFNPH